MLLLLKQPLLFLGRYMCFITELKRPIWNKRSLSPLENSDFRKYSFEELTQFSPGNNVLGVAGCNTHALLSRDSSVSSTQLNRPTWIKISLSLASKRSFAESIPFKN
jgi:hypothetical protein